MKPVVLATLTSFVAAAVLTWAVRWVAVWLGVLDHPDGSRKLHPAPVPLLGGVAIFLAWAIGLVASSALGAVKKPIVPCLGAGPGFLGGGLNLGNFTAVLFLAACVVLGTGVLDDLFTLRPRWKLLGQTLAAAVLVGNGLVVRRLSVFGSTVELGLLGVVFTFVWLVGSMNAVNMLDGLDGLATGVGLMTCLTLGCMAWLTHAPWLALPAVALAGALAGFLLHNFPPARIFLGDSGSLLIGLVIGAIAIQGSFKAEATAALSAPILMLAIPIFDGVAAVIRRRLTGVACLAPDLGHIHHCLVRRGWTNQQVLAGVGLLSAITGSLALASLYLRRELIAVLATLAVIGGCVVTRLFGYYEYRLLMGRTSAWWVLWRGSFRLKQPNVLGLCCRLRQSRSIEGCWATLVAGAEEFQLARLELHLGGTDRPFQARWRGAASPRDLPLWGMVIPLISLGAPLGSLNLGGHLQPRAGPLDLIRVVVLAETVAEVCGNIIREDSPSTLALPSNQPADDPEQNRRPDWPANNREAA